MVNFNMKHVSISSYIKQVNLGFQRLFQLFISLLVKVTRILENVKTF